MDTASNYNKLKPWARRVVDGIKPGRLHSSVSDKLPAWASRVQASTGEPLSFKDLNAAYQFLRSSDALLRKSRLVAKSNLLHRTSLQLRQLLEGDTALTPLELKDITHSLTKCGLGPERPYGAKKTRLGIASGKRQYDDDECVKGVAPDKQLSDYLEDSARQTRKSEWIYRVVNETERCIDDKWFPLFGTYTVDPAVLPELGLLHRDEVFTDANAWDKFIKRFKAEIADCLGYGRKPSKWPPTRSWFRYFACIEHGQSGEHPHIHCLFFLKGIPDGWKHDPNYGNRFNLLFDIPAASALWEYGEQKETKGLFVTGSWFAENWETPVKYEDGKFREITVGNPAIVAGYIGKYMGKGAQIKWTNGKYHRVRATKSLGMDKIRLALLDCPLRLLLAASKRVEDYSQVMAIQSRTSVPLSLLRRQSKTELMRRLHSLKARLAERYLLKIWTREPSEFYTKLLKLAETGVRVNAMMPSERYRLYTQIMAESDSMAHCRPWLSEFAQWVAGTFPERVVSYERVPLRTSAEYGVLR